MRPVAPASGSIEAVLAPRSVAIVGASPTSFVGRILCENLRTVGYEGRVFPINPRYDRILDWPCFPSLDEVPEVPEALAVAVRIDLVPSVLRRAGELGVRGAVVPGGGFSETGQAALDAQREISALADEFGMTVVGPNCMGVITPPRRSALYIGSIPESLLAGRVALVSQSGSVCEAAANMGPRIGFSAIVSCGTEAATTVGDYLRHFAQDPGTNAVALFLEGFRDPAGFVDGARAMREADKPLAVLQAGRSKEAAAAIAAHSGTLAGTDEVVTGLLRQVGAIGVDDLDELFEVAELLGHGRLPKGRRAFVVTDSGGEANLVADHARWQGLELPRPSPRLVERLQARWPNFSYIGNPVDPWGVDADFEPLYEEILRGAAEEDVDIVAVALDKVTPWAGENELELGVAAGRSLADATSTRDKIPVFLTLHATGPAAEQVRKPLRAEGVPLLHGLRPALVALAKAAWWRAWRPRSPVAHDHEPAPVTYFEDGPILSERASRQVLAAYGIPVVEGVVAPDEDAALAVADRIGYPLVMKADTLAVAHKAAAGLVITGVVDAEGVLAAFATLRTRSREAALEFRGALIERTASGVELICGMRRDHAFGPVVLLGLGGTLTEVLHDVSVRVCPVAPEDLEEMVGESAVGKLLAARGVDPAPVLEVVGALARLGLERDEIEEVDVNPLFAGPDGVVAADALVVLGRAPAKGDQSAPQTGPVDEPDETKGELA
jgi:acyl-CoA synthetase (NDP forming)